MPVSNMHVLLADDFRNVMELLAEVLEEFSPVDITIDCANNGAEALAMALERPPAVALLDINMPVMDGIEAAVAIRSALPDTLLIALTGNVANMVSVRSRTAFDHVLSKPVRIDDLVDLLWPA